eukprot:9702528-Alexandrium_andersonii.AAC.1
MSAGGRHRRQKWGRRHRQRDGRGAARRRPWPAVPGQLPPHRACCELASSPGGPARGRAQQCGDSVAEQSTGPPRATPWAR